MKIKKKKGFNLELILRELAEHRTVKSDGSISYPSLDTSQYNSYFLSAVESKVLSDAVLADVIEQAMNAQQDMTENQFLKHCNRIASLKLESSRRKFKVVFPIWGGHELMSGRRKWHGVTINFSVATDSSFLRKAKEQRAGQLHNSESPATIVARNLPELPVAVCSVMAVSPPDAFEQAELAMAKELGLYSLTAARGEYIFSNNPDHPINTLLLAPHMTVHGLDGTTSVGMFWYNRWPVSFTQKSRTQEERHNMRQQAERVRFRLRKLPWRENAEAALARHYTTFSQCDPESAFLDGWRLLETIGGQNREKSETLVKRAAWLFENCDEMYQIGLHLMERRNGISHGRAIKAADGEALAFQMKWFVTPLFHHYLMNPYGLQDTGELWDFCDMPFDKSKRKRQAKLLKHASVFRRER